MNFDICAGSQLDLQKYPRLVSSFPFVICHALLRLPLEHVANCHRPIWLIRLPSSQHQSIQQIMSDISRRLLSLVEHCVNLVGLTMEKWVDVVYV